ncbi:hypothetical protein E4S40_10675 [Algoriphagus kandeliae]|uniref:TOTE conflict systems S1/CSD-like domain-containing protein n=1 Tax=Algoriphagus kandeliae TaxID=2562278 RepID=A0A4Y9QQK9_9BACT|nr:hypothetical protein [Algoriphagus kandeliae]TFV94477.1 hypothetical protein E4S40_10675 [Algoriphagus kandeliae]
MTRNQLYLNPADIWAKRNHSWSIYYLIKKHIKAGQTAQAKHYLEEFSALQMPDEEKLLHERMKYFFKVLEQGYLRIKQLIAEEKFEEAFHLELKKENADLEQLSWIVYYLLRSFNKTGKPSPTKTMELLQKLMQHYTPSKRLVNKLILQELIKTPADFWVGQKQSYSLEKVGLFDILEEDDFQKQEWEGKKLISLAERLHITYSKALLREKVAEEKILAYIRGIVEPTLEKYPAMIYVPYFKAKLLLGIGDRASGISAFLPFAKKKAGEFWVWQVFAEVYEDDPKLYFSCLCKAMTCKTKPEFLSNIQEKLISHFIKTGKYDQAKSELDKLMKLRERQRWGIKTIHRQYLDSNWYNRAENHPTNYRDHVAKAEALIGITPYESLLVIVHHVNREKKVFGFLIEENKSGFGKYLKEPIPNRIYRLEGNFGKGDFFNVKKQKEVEGNSHPLLRLVEGKVIKKVHQAFAFVDGNFIPPELVKKNRLMTNENVKGTALLAPLKGKKEWAWKVISIQKNA